MKKIIRLTESDLTRIVKRILKESNDDPRMYHRYTDGGNPGIEKFFEEPLNSTIARELEDQLEDDEYANIWVKNFKEYAEIYQNVDSFLPIVVDVDDKGVFVGFTNEATFAANFSSEMGVLTNETLMSYQNFQISGMIIKKESFITNGMLKPSFELTFGYEFLLRMTHNSVRFMTIPKIGYKHTNLREGSIFWNYKNGDNRLSEDEVRFWIDSAKKEYLYTNQRDIKYEPLEV